MPPLGIIRLGLCRRLDKWRREDLPPFEFDRNSSVCIFCLLGIAVVSSLHRLGHKCMREMHFYLEEEEEEEDGGWLLNATVLMRAQAAEIFPKNIHFIGSLMDRVADGLNQQCLDGASDDMDASRGKGRVNLGVLFYLATTLVSVRED